MGSFRRGMLIPGLVTMVPMPVVAVHHTIVRVIKMLAMSVVSRGSSVRAVRWLLVITTVIVSAAVTAPLGGAAASNTVTFTYTGSEQSVAVPTGTTSLAIVAVGGSGATTSSASGGHSAVVTAILPVPQGVHTLYVEVGGNGSGSSGGFNGGGDGSGGGGGASDVRTCSGSATSCNTLASRLVVAGGGGGAGADGTEDTPGCAALSGGNGGDGGSVGTAGSDGQSGTGGEGAGGGGGTATSGGGAGAAGTGDLANGSPGSQGLLGSGGAGGDYANPGGGGGGGYYGGGGGGGGGQLSGSYCTAFGTGGGGGGGSSYVDASASSSSISTDTTGTPTISITFINLTVNTLSDDPSPQPTDYSQCPLSSATFTLRCAILWANHDCPAPATLPSSPTPCDTISFSVTGEIQPTSPLPDLTAYATTINGYGAPGASPNMNGSIASGDNAVIRVQLDGGKTSGVNGLHITGPWDTVRGLSITGWTGGSGIYTEGDDTTVAGDFIGLAPNGSAAGNALAGAAFSNGNNNVVGGPNPADRNVIGSNTDDGVYGSYSSGDTVENNVIGADPTGRSSRPNGLSGVHLDDGTSNSTIGGSATATSNLISGNVGYGVSITGQDTSNVVEGNLIGTNAAGTAALPNTGGVYVNALTGTMIGGAGGAGNVISGNGGNGVEIAGGTTTTVADTRIGVTASGAPLPNSGNGVYAHGDASGAVIGGTTSGVANTIAYNGGAGVLIGSSATDTNHVSIRQNAIFANGGLAIQLNGQTPPVCSSGPTSGAPNDFIPCPVISSVSTSQVSGTACPGCRVEVFVVNSPADSSGYGGGQAYLGTAIVNGSGAWTLGQGIDPSRQQVTATATQLASGPTPDETSMFAANMPLGAPIAKGWNLLAVPVQTPNPYHASDLTASLTQSLGSGAVQAIATYENGRFNVYVPGYSADATLTPGQGFFALSGRSGQWIPSGNPLAAAQNVALSPGWNLAAAPYPGRGFMTDTIAHEIDPAACPGSSCSVTEIAGYSNGRYQVYQPTVSSSTPFFVPATSGAWIESQYFAEWTPA